jgi:alkylation response protein AidB-like acyl-CoA dehydrogenase
LRKRWAPVGDNGSVAGDVTYGVRLGEELASLAPSGVAIGTSLHTETVLSMLHRFAGSSEYLAALREDAMDARQIGCIAASEPRGGSDLGAISCLARPTARGWVISGRKKYVSLGSVADFAIVLCRVATADGEPTDRHATIVVPLADVEIVRAHDKLGTHALDTVVVDFDDVAVDGEAVLGRVGLGVLNLNYGLSFERLAIASQVAGGCATAIALAVEHAQRRVQFGKRLLDHQYISFRLAELKAEADVLGSAVRSIAREMMTRPLDRELITRIASVKLCAARAGERLVSEAMQVFGGPGYLPRETPFGQFWNDIRVARIGAGTDEMMLMIIADSLHGNPDLYERLVDISQ